MILFCFSPKRFFGTFLIFLFFKVYQRQLHRCHYDENLNKWLHDEKLNNWHSRRQIDMTVDHDQTLPFDVTGEHLGPATKPVLILINLYIFW